MESGTIVRWLKGESERVEKGEALYELDTDKVTQEVEAEADGVLLKILVRTGEVPVGTPVAFIGRAGEELPDAPAVDEVTMPEPEPQRSEAPAAAVRPPAGGRRKASPLARRIAREQGVDLAALSGSGPDGRIVAEDVERAVIAPSRAVPVPAGEVERVPLGSLRRTAARRLAEAWEAPVFQLSRTVDMTRAQELIARRGELDPDVRVTVTDLLAKLCAVALMRHPDVNVQYTEDALLVFPSANVGIAVATPAGLVVPVVTAAERKSLGEIAAVRAGLVERARAGTLEYAELAGGTFTISNLGMFGVEQFTAVLNPPQAAILAVGATEDRVVAIDGGPAVRPVMTITLSCDHRAVDGAAGAAFLRTVAELVEEPGLAL